MEAAGSLDQLYIFGTLLSLGLLPYVAMPIADAFCVVGRLLPQRKAVDTSEQESRIEQLERELENINMFNQFAEYTRRKRQIVALSAEIRQIQQREQKNPSYLRFKVTAAVALILILLMLHCMVKYYGVAVLRFPAVWFKPFNWLLSFPGTTPNDQTAPVSIGFLVGLTLCTIRYTAMGFIYL